MGLLNFPFMQVGAGMLPAKPQPTMQQVPFTGMPMSQFPQDPNNDFGVFGPGGYDGMMARNHPNAAPRKPAQNRAAPRAPRAGDLPMYAPELAAMPIEGAQMPQGFMDPNGNPTPNVIRQPQPGDQATGQGGDWWSNLAGDVSKAFEGMKPTDWMQLGTALLAGSQNGGDWSVVNQGISQMAQGMEERKRYEAQQKRQDEQDAMHREMFGFQKQEMVDNAADRQLSKRERERMAALQTETVAGLKGTNPQLAAVLEAQSPEQFGAFYGQKYLADEQLKVEQARLDAQQRWQMTMQRDQQAFQERMAKIKDPKDKLTYQAGLKQLVDSSGAASEANKALADMDRMKVLVERLGSLSGMSQPFDNSMQNLFDRARNAGQGTEAQTLREQIEGLSASMVRQYAEALKPMSNTDFQWVQSIVPNSQMTMASALNRIEQERSKLQWDVDRYYKMADWNEQYNGVVGTKDEQGRTFEESLGKRPTPAYDDSKYTGSGQYGQAVARPKPGEIKMVDGQPWVYIGGPNSDPKDKKNWQAKSSPPANRSGYWR